MSNAIDDKALKEIKEELHQEMVGALVFFKTRERGTS